MANVYAIVNVLPEIQAFALAKVSRASGSCQDWIMKLTEAGTSKFLEKHYADNPYGHASLGDLGHPAIALEGVSQWMAHILELPWFGPWDGQELSTRFSNFAGKECYWPDLDVDARDLYRSILDRLFLLYDQVLAYMKNWYRLQYPKLANWSEERYEKTVSARAFDVARYCLPMAVKTSVMQVASIRVLQRQISYLMSDLLAEARALGEQLLKAVQEPAFDVAREALLRARLEDLLPADLPGDLKKTLLGDEHDVALMGILKEGVLEKILPERAAAAVLAKHAKPSRYLMQTREEMEKLALEYLPPISPHIGPLRDSGVTVHKIDRLTPKKQTVAALLFWQAPGHSFRRVLETVKDMKEADITRVFRAGLAFRSEYDEALPMYRSGYYYMIDWHLDIGCLRDIHRQRRQVSVPQKPSTNHGYVVPAPLLEAKLDADYVAVMNKIQQDIRRLEKIGGYEAAIYATPFAQGRHYLMFPDLGQIDYIGRLRANPNGRHFGYWGPAYEMCRQMIADDEDYGELMGATPLDEWDFYNRG